MKEEITFNTSDKLFRRKNGDRQAMWVEEQITDVSKA